MGDVFLKVSEFFSNFPKSLANFETNIKTDNEDLKSSEVVDSTKNGSTEPNPKNEVSTGIFLTKLESSEEPTSVVDSNKTESNTEAMETDTKDLGSKDPGSKDQNEEGTEEDKKGLPKEEADNAILLFWKMWRKEKAKKKKHAKRLEEKNAKREAQGLPPIDKMKDVDPEQLKDNPSLLTSIKEKDRQPYIPADIQTYAN